MTLNSVNGMSASRVRGSWRRGLPVWTIGWLLLSTLAASAAPFRSGEVRVAFWPSDASDLMRLIRVNGYVFDPLV